jgi:hypothetical protein
METGELRSTIKAAAIGLVGARIFPNGCGFYLRGTEYSIDEAKSRPGAIVWTAVRRHDDPELNKYGQGGSPQAAKLAAGIGRDKHTRSRPL